MVDGVLPECDVLHVVEVRPVEGGLKMLVHEVETLFDGEIGPGMSFSVWMICVDDGCLVCEGSGKWTPGAYHVVWTETDDDGIEICVKSLLMAVVVVDPWLAKEE